MAQAHFQFLPLSLKNEELQTNVSLQQDLDKVRYLKELLATNQSELVESRLLSSTAEFFKIVEEIDSKQFDGL
jgi:hypothetical protein